MPPPAARLWRWLACVACACAGCASPTHTGAASDAAAPPVHVTRNPYEGVNWARGLRLKTALHEHVRDDPDHLRAMDRAGYNAVPLMHYSGVPSKSYAWRERHWPPERVLPAELFDALKSIKLFFSSGEEIGYHHMTSPLLTTYIARWDPKHYERREDWHYGSTQQAIDLIQRQGGLAFLAHPWKNPKHYERLRRFAGMEIYNAYCRHKFQVGEHGHDRNSRLLKNWDRVLMQRPSVIGIAVNDWFGPWRDRVAMGASLDVYDSGKVIVLARAATLTAFSTALAGGAVLAVVDLGEVKDQFPRVRAIDVDATAIRIELADPDAAQVHWVADGARLDHVGSELPLAVLRPDTHYVRAEVVNADGSTIYTQAFATR